MPERIPQLSLDDVRALADLPYAQRAARIYRAFDVDLPADVVDELMAQAYGDNFDDERICPITSLTANTHVLELWHGPHERVQGHGAAVPAEVLLGERLAAARAGASSTTSS